MQAPALHLCDALEVGETISYEYCKENLLLLECPLTAAAGIRSAYCLFFNHLSFAAAGAAAGLCSLVPAVHTLGTHTSFFFFLVSLCVPVSALRRPHANQVTEKKKSSSQK